MSSESHFDPLIDSRPNSENHDTELEQEGNVGQQQPQQTLGRGDDKRMPVAGVQHDAEMLVDDGCKPKQLVVENNDMHHDMAADVEDVEGGELSSDLQKHVDLPTGNTLTTTDVKVKVPFLLRHTLREYQHVGLDWLAKLYTNGLSGILADEMVNCCMNENFSMYLFLLMIRDWAKQFRQLLSSHIWLSRKEFGVFIYLYLFYFEFFDC